MKSHLRVGYLRLALAVYLTAIASHAFAQPAEPVFSLAKKEKSALLETLKALVSIETGSRDFEGLSKLADLIAKRLEEHRRLPTCACCAWPTMTESKTK